MTSGTFGSAALHGLGPERERRALLPLGAGEESDLDAVEGLGPGLGDLVSLAVDLDRSGAARQHADLVDRKFALLEDADHLHADGARADDGHVVFLHDRLLIE
jgi:hypothetical protein